MTTTSNDNDNGDQDDMIIGEDIPPHLSHPGTENPENPTEFHSLKGEMLSVFVL